MTDPTPRVTACLDCRALIPASTDDRRKHREWHADLNAKHRGVQKTIAEYRDLTSKTAAALVDLRRDVDNTEIPEPVEPLHIEEWPDDELDDQPESQYLDDPQTDDSYATTPSASYSAVDEDDYPPRVIDPTTGLPR